LLQTLQTLGVAPIGGRAFEVTFQTDAPQSAKPAFEWPTVSCLLVTNGARRTMACAIECYQRQTYEPRELVIVTHPDGLEAVNAAVASSGAENVAVHCVGRELTLGDCRNLSIARSTGQVVMQWDDDDLYDPMRVNAAVSLLRSVDATAAMLRRVLVWWPDRRLAAISKSRLWEGSIAVWRDHAPIYPGLARGEDTTAVECVSTTRAVASYEAALLYVYIIHDGNTWDLAHFEEVIAESEQVIEGDDYEALVRLIAQRVPAERYLAEMARDRSDPLRRAAKAPADG
jgi:glycosyltransferase involved in cell wall biosynthesis